MSSNRDRHERWYERIPTERDEQTVKLYAAWLCRAPWQLYVTLTFAWPVSDIQGDRVFTAFIRALERKLHAPIAFVRGDEKRFSGCGKPASPRHYHLLLASTAMLVPLLIQMLWWRFGGCGADHDSAKAELINSPQKAAAYCLKFVNEADGDWRFHNLELFMPDVATARRNAAWKAWHERDRDRRTTRHTAPRSRCPRLGLMTGHLPQPRLCPQREAAGPSPA